MSALWSWFVQTNTSSWVLASLASWSFLHWLKTLDLSQRMRTAERLFLSEQGKLRHLENEHVRLERRTNALELHRRVLDGDDQGDGPYRSADHSPGGSEMANDDDDPFEAGQRVDVKINGGPWFRAQFCGLITVDCKTLHVRLICGTPSPEVFDWSRVEMRHTRSS